MKLCCSPHVLPTQNTEITGIHVTMEKDTGHILETISFLTSQMRYTSSSPGAYSLQRNPDYHLE